MSRVGTVNFFEQVNEDTFIDKEFRFFQSDGSTPLDLSDVTPRVQIRKDNYNGKLMRTCTIGDGLTWVNQSDGTFRIGGFRNVWEGAGDYYYDIQFTYATSGVIRTYVRGKIQVIDHVTRDA